VNEFVEECRSEWRRLGVPDPVADEMAAELAADLEEAEREGASAEQVLGTGALDPRGFAGAWAAERGVIERPTANARARPRRLRLAAALAVFALIAISGAVLVILATPSAPGRLAVAAPAEPPMLARGPVWVRPARLPAPGPARIVVSPDGRQIVTVTDDVPPFVTLRRGPIATVDINDSGVDTRTVGSVLLTVGLAGFVPLTMFWLWFGTGRRSRRFAGIDDRPIAPA
jgi:hypothetical protein